MGRKKLSDVEKVDNALEKMLGEIVTLQKVENTINQKTKCKYNHWEELYECIGENFLDIVKNGAIDYTIDNDNVGILFFDIVTLDEENPMNSKILIDCW